MAEKLYRVTLRIDNEVIVAADNHAEAVAEAMKLRPAIPAGEWTDVDVERR